MTDNLLQSGATWLMDKLQAHAGRTVSVKQGRSVVAGIVASVSRIDYKVEIDGAATVVPSFDWTFQTSDLGGLELRKGAEISETLDGTIYKYEAMPIEGYPAVEWADTSGRITRVRTKKVE
jgi:hypothetical protein